MSLEELYQTSYTEKKWLIEDLLPENGIGILSGHPGSSKTWLLMHMATMVASGGSVFGRFAARREKVLMVDEENRPALLKERFRLLAAQPELPIFLWVKSGFQASGHSMDKLLNFVYQNDIKFVTFDSLIRIHSGDENVSREVSELFRNFSGLQAIGVTILITHHHRKDSATQVNRRSQSLRGSSDILAGLDTHLTVEKKGKNQLEITQTKSRDAEEIGSFSVAIESTPELISFNYQGESASTTRDLAKMTILKLLSERTELFRNDLLALLKGQAGENAIGEAIRDLVTDSVIQEHHGEKNKKYYTLKESQLVS